MTTEELKDIIETIQRTKAEGQTVEVKEALVSYPKKLFDTLSSFSNQDDGGVIVFGLSEREQFKAVGVYDLHDLQQKVTDQCNQMDPPVRAVFTHAVYDGKEVCSAEIPAVDVSERPCFYKGVGKTKGSYIRVGDADLPMTEYEIYSFDAYRKHLHDDERKVDRATLELLSSEKLDRYITDKKEERPRFAQLEDNAIFEMLNITRNNVPTLAAVLNFGLYPQGLFPQLGIVAIVIPGYEIGDVSDDNSRFIDNKRIEGTLDELVEGAVTFCRKNMRVKTIINNKSGRREDKAEYPIQAIREVILNAVIHRDYSRYTEGTPIQLNLFKDRLEVRNPGGLYGRLTVDQLGYARPDSRNPVLAVMAENLTSAENRYSGIPTIRREMKESNLPEPVFASRRGEFIVTLLNDTNPHQHIGTTDLNYTERDRIIEFCQIPRDKNEISELIGIKTTNYVMNKHINPMLEQGVLKMTLPDKPQSKLQKYVTV